MGFLKKYEKIGHINVLILEGYLERDAGLGIRGKVEELVQKGDRRFVIDFKECPIINSLCLGELLDMVSICISQPAVKFFFCSLTTISKNNFTMVGMFNFAEYFDSRETALNAATSQLP